MTWQCHHLLLTLGNPASPGKQQEKSFINLITQKPSNKHLLLSGGCLPVYSPDPQNVIAGHSSFPDLCDNVHTVSIATASLKKQILKVYNLVVGRRSFVAICLKQYLFSCNDVTKDGGGSYSAFNSFLTITGARQWLKAQSCSPQLKSANTESLRKPRKFY